MQRKIYRLGHSYCIILPMAILKQLDAKVGDTLSVEATKGNIKLSKEGENSSQN